MGGGGEGVGEEVVGQYGGTVGERGIHHESWNNFLGERFVTAHDVGTEEILLPSESDSQESVEQRLRLAVARSRSYPSPTQLVEDLLPVLDKLSDAVLADPLADEEEFSLLAKQAQQFCRGVISDNQMDLRVTVRTMVEAPRGRRTALPVRGEKNPEPGQVSEALRKALRRIFWLVHALQHYLDFDKNPGLRAANEVHLHLQESPNCQRDFSAPLLHLQTALEQRWGEEFLHRVARAGSPGDRARADHLGSVGGAADQQSSTGYAAVPTGYPPHPSPQLSAPFGETWPPTLVSEVVHPRLAGVGRPLQRSPRPNSVGRRKPNTSLTQKGFPVPARSAPAVSVGVLSRHHAAGVSPPKYTRSAGAAQKPSGPAVRSSYGAVSRPGVQTGILDRGPGTSDQVVQTKIPYDIVTIGISETHDNTGTIKYL